MTRQVGIQICGRTGSWCYPRFHCPSQSLEARQPFRHVPEEYKQRNGVQVAIP